MVFNTLEMTITIPLTKMAEIAKLVAELQHRTHASLHQLRALLGKLLNISQYCIPACFVLNQHLEFRKDLEWFAQYLLIKWGVHDA